MKLDREAVIFGVADGMTSFTGLVLGFAVTGHLEAAWVAGFSSGVAAFPGMASGRYQSAPQDGITSAAVCGLSTTAGSIVPAVPFLTGHGVVQVIASLSLTAALCAVVAVLRPQKGVRAWVLSYGITAAAALLSLALGFTGA